MRTDFDADFLRKPEGARANEILRSCVHCGFCNATCPTYQLTGDELDGPRGRIYIIRDLLQSGENTDRAQHHLDRCLTCRACETTCPSGVKYSELAEIARNEIGPNRNGLKGAYRFALAKLIPEVGLFRSLARIGRMFRWLLPGRLSAHVPRKVYGVLPSQELGALPEDAPSVILLNGCAQQVTTGNTNRHLQEVLTERGIRVVTSEEEVCCGALPLHLGDDSSARGFARQNVDWIYEQLADVTAVVSTASGCGVTVKEYDQLLAKDPVYAERANQVGQRTLDVAQYLNDLNLTWEATHPMGTKVAWHSPCSLQHGQQVNGVVESILRGAGYELVPVKDGHLCCGSAGTYSVLQPKLSRQLKANKLSALTQEQPELIATANVGCQNHLESDAPIPVLHWIELIK
ncbi:MAG: glycolate oxidase subunit GlcF [Pseudomonadota bacterium]